MIALAVDIIEHSFEFVQKVLAFQMTCLTFELEVNPVLECASFIFTYEQFIIRNNNNISACYIFMPKLKKKLLLLRE